jgi:hypothetical protein
MKWRHTTMMGRETPMLRLCRREPRHRSGLSAKTRHHHDRLSAALHDALKRWKETVSKAGIASAK